MAASSSCPLLAPNEGWAHLAHKTDQITEPGPFGLDIAAFDADERLVTWRDRDGPSRIAGVDEHGEDVRVILLDLLGIISGLKGGMSQLGTSCSLMVLTGSEIGAKPLTMVFCPACVPPASRPGGVSPVSSWLLANDHQANSRLRTSGHQPGRPENVF